MSCWTWYFVLISVTMINAKLNVTAMDRYFQEFEESSSWYVERIEPEKIKRFSWKSKCKKMRNPVQESPLDEDGLSMIRSYHFKYNFHECEDLYMYTSDDSDDDSDSDEDDRIGNRNSNSYSNTNSRSKIMHPPNPGSSKSSAKTNIKTNTLVSLSLPKLDINTNGNTTSHDNATNIHKSSAYSSFESDINHKEDPMEQTFPVQETAVLQQLGHRSRGISLPFQPPDPDRRSSLAVPESISQSIPLDLDRSISAPIFNLIPTTSVMSQEQLHRAGSSANPLVLVGRTKTSKSSNTRSHTPPKDTNRDIRTSSENIDLKIHHPLIIMESTIDSLRSISTGSGSGSRSRSSSANSVRSANSRSSANSNSGRSTRSTSSSRSET